MVTTNGAAASDAATKKKRLSKILIANLIVFVMVSSAFFVAVAAAGTVTPKVWTNALEYYPGENVVILGEGFLSGPVTITLTHWSKGVQDVNFVDVAMVGDDGKFRYEGYSAEAVEDAKIPVMILAYQDAEHQATGSFLDPAATEKVEGFTLEGVNSWTTGDTRGYNEGDSIPIRVYVPNIYGTLTVTVKVAVDFYDTTKGYRVYGIDYLTRLLYTPDPPVPPWNTYTNMSGTPGWTPFSVDPATATIVSAARVANQLESPNQMLLIWEFTMQFASVSVEYAYVHFGAHLAVTNLGANPIYYGASFYPGSSLHARFVSVNGVDIGNKELPIPTRVVLTPPSMHISKVCNPAAVPLGGVVTFTIDMWNTGEADALSVVLLDTLPSVVSYLPGTAQYWTTSTGMWQAFRDPDSSNIVLNTITWNIGTIRGTGKTNEGLPALPVFHYKVMFSVQVHNDALPKTYTNLASITHVDAGGNTYGPFSATCSFDVVVVGFEKYADRECAAVGETITYWFVIRNPSMVTLTYKLWDPLFKPYDPNDPLWTGTLPPKSLVIVDKDDIPALEHTVTADDDDHLINTACITFTDGNNVEITQWASWEVDILHPAIIVEKSANLACAAENDIVTFTITVTNPTLETEMWYTVYDPLLAPIYGDPLWNGYLVPGQSETRTFDYLVPDIPVDPADPLAWELLNVVLVDAHDYQYVAGEPWAHLHWVHAEARVAVDIYHPAIEIEKWADKACAAEGEVVKYFIQVHNPTLDTPMDFQVSDPLLGGIIWGPGSVDMWGHAYWTLSPGEYVTFGGDITLDVVPNSGYVYLPALEYTVTGEEATDPYENVASVLAWDPQGHYVAANSDGWTVDIRHVDIEIYKWADKKCAAVGEEVIYYINVQNRGDTPEDFVLTDSLLGLIWGFGTGITGDVFDDPYWTLGPGESVTFGGDPTGDVVYQDGYVYIAKMKYTITGDEDLDQDGYADDPLVNMAAAFAWDNQYILGDMWADLHSDLDESSWEVDVRHPSIYFNKYADKTCAAVGEEVTYFIDVYNDGDTPLDFVIMDSLLGLIWGYGTGITGDMFNDPYWTLQPGDWVTFGGDPNGDVIWQDGYVYISKMRYTITGVEDLNGDLLADDPLINMASVFAWDDQYVEGDQWARLHIACGDDSWEVDVRHPAIYINKWADKTCAAVGEDVTYFIDVWNTGDTPLDFVLTDDLLGTIWGFNTGITGDKFGDPYWTLGPGEWITFGGDPNGDFVWQDGYVYLSELKYTITGTEDLNGDGVADDPLVNTASIFAWDDQYVLGDEWADLHSVGMSSSWEVDVRHVGISIYKWADKSCAAVDEMVTYYITVSNTGDTPEDFILTDDLLGTIWGYGTGIVGDMFGDPYWTLGPGESVTFGGDPMGDVVYQDGYVYIAKMAYWITDEDDDPLVNTASVFAWDNQYIAGDLWADLHSASGSSSWTIDVRHVEVEIVKWADKYCAAVGEEVNFFIQVHNPTDTWLDFTVYDWLLGFIWGPGSMDKFGYGYWTLAPGEYITFGGDESQDVVPNNGYVYVPALKYTILDSDPDPLMNFATVEVWDDQYIPGDQWSFLHYNWANSNEVLIDIRHIDVEVTKWADKSCAAIGEDVKYFIYVYNPTDTVLDFTLVDSQLGYLWGPGSVDMWGHPYWPLQPYEAVEFGGEILYDSAPNNGYVYLPALDHTITVNDPDPLINTATVTVWDDQYVVGDPWAYLHIKTVESNEWEVDIRIVGISVYKWADKTCAAVGEDITYYITVTNTGNTPEDFLLTDDLLGTIWGYGTGIVGDMFGDPYWTLGPGESVTFGGDPMGDVVYQDGYVYIAKMRYTVTDTEDLNQDGYVDDPLVNTARVFAWDDQYMPGDIWAHLHSASDTSSWEVDVRHPSLYFYKYADKSCAAVGEEVTYFIDVWNTGDTPLDFVITDDLLGIIWGFGTGITGDKFGDPYWTLAPGDWITFGGDPNGDFVWQDGYVYISELRYTITGAEDLNGDLLADDPLVNTASVFAWDDQYRAGDEWADLHSISDSDSWEVDVRHPGILLDKWADKTCAAVGEDIAYYFYVENTGDTTLTFDLYDDLFGGWGYTGTLVPGEWILLYYVHTVTGTEDVNGDGMADDPLVNTAWVNAWDDQYRADDQWAPLHWVTSIDTYSVDIRHPVIVVNKWADKSCAEAGEVVTYTIEVRNVGDTPLDFVLTDNLLGTIWGYNTGITGDKFGDPYWTLGIGESIWFGGDPNGDVIWQDGYVYIAKMAYTVTDMEDLNQDGFADDPLINTASVTAWDDQWRVDDQWSQLHIRYGSDSWTVDILHPMIWISKIVYPDEVMVGEWVTYEITVWNPSWDTYMDFVLTDSMFGILWGFGTGITGDNFNDPYWTLAPGEMVTFGGNAAADVVFQDGYVYLSVLHYQVQPSDFPERINVATVEAWDYQLHYRYASDDAELTVLFYATLSGYVYQDNDLNDNLIGPGDVGLLNWRVTLTGVDYFGNPVNRFVFSDGTGFYDFGDIIPGTYTVAEVLAEHPGWVNTGPVSYAFNIAGGEDKRFDFGNIQYGRITGVKWLDDHMNGYQDLAPWPEPGLEGWIIHLHGILVNGDEVWATTTTGPDGSYAFENLLPGIYDVWEEVPPGEDPADWVAITPSMYEDVEIQSGWEVTCCKFGNVRLESICGWKFYDWNMNRVKDGEPGIEGWKITLVGWLNDGLFPFQPDGATQVGPITIETDANGVWCFTGLLPGVYVISEENRDGWYHTTPMSVTFWIASYHGVSQVKFGNVPMNKITGQKFFDKDMDGVMDLGEPGLGGWTITLEKEVSPGVWNNLLTTVTDPTGAYEFKWLLPGKYRVNEILLSGWFATSALPIEIVIPAYTVSHQLVPGCVVQNIGNVMYGSICGYKFEDLIGPNGEYPNGMMDANEYGIGNWEIVLEGRQVNKVLVQRTVYTVNVGSISDIGKYLFANLLPGVYWVNETLMEHWIPTTTCVAKLYLTAYPFWPVNMVQNFGNMHPVDPELNFVLKAGTSMWSSPLQMQSELRASELAAIIGSSCAKITKWNTTTKSWQHFIPGFTPANSAKDFRLKNGEGYYIGVRVFTTFQLTGDLVSDSTVDLVAGANLVGYNTLRPLRASEFVNLVSLQGGKVMKISTLNENGQWQHFIPGFTPAGSAKDYTMTQGHSYMVFTTTGGVITYPAA